LSKIKVRKVGKILGSLGIVVKKLLRVKGGRAI